MTVSTAGKEARTRYEVVATYHRPGRRSRCSSAGSRPAAPTRSACTSRSIGHPVVGDDRYGGARPSFPVDRPFLHAAALRLRATRSPASALAFDSPLPADLAGRARPALAEPAGVTPGSGDRFAGPGRVAPGHGDDVGQGEGVEVAAHVLADVGPDGQQHALALVVAGAVGVGLAEVAGHDRAVDGADDRRSA